MRDRGGLDLVLLLLVTLAGGCAGASTTVREPTAVTGAETSRGGDAGAERALSEGAGSAGVRPAPIPIGSAGQNLVDAVLEAVGEPTAGRVRTVEVRPVVPARAGVATREIAVAAEAWERLRTEANRAGLGRVRFVLPDALPDGPARESAVDAVLDAIGLDGIGPEGGGGVGDGESAFSDRAASPGSTADDSVWLEIRLRRGESLAPAFTLSVAVSPATR